MEKQPGLNREWHLHNRMPKNASTEQRIAWHIEHAQHCTCRPIPAPLLEACQTTKSVNCGAV